MRLLVVALLAVGCSESQVVDRDPCAAISDEAECCAAGCTFLVDHERCVSPERVCSGGSGSVCGGSGTCGDVRDYGSSCFDACVRGGGCFTAITPYGVCTPWDPPDASD
ncbi:MAG: hypothetical protein JJ863_05925 [Deltaproteobacteria bacterium]|nr:hypothetical protein [Deltaproteobacteria bacterium]